MNGEHCPPERLEAFERYANERRINNGESWFEYEVVMRSFFSAHFTEEIAELRADYVARTRAQNDGELQHGSQI